MRFAFLLPILLADASLVSASDDRLLYTIPHPGAMDSFASDFGTTCATWEPAIHGASLIFSEALVEPGDFSGKNNQTQALLVADFL
ncbi:hypothetical protein B0H13DRAFT_2322440 [Mycena leptocephala]|nr:hypothetical protein B0H13DRAFT_2322440 [Mycena leptocephala]